MKLMFFVFFYPFLGLILMWVIGQGYWFVLGVVNGIRLTLSL